MQILKWRTKEDEVEDKSEDKSKGPVKWCKMCSRYHGSREGCELVAEEREAKSGRKVTRMVHPSKDK